MICGLKTYGNNIFQGTSGDILRGTSSLAAGTGPIVRIHGQRGELDGFFISKVSDLGIGIGGVFTLVRHRRLPFGFTARIIEGEWLQQRHGDERVSRVSVRPLLTDIEPPDSVAVARRLSTCEPVHQ